MRQGRVFALVPGDVQNTETVVSGILSICTQNAYVLIDSGSNGLFSFREKACDTYECVDPESIST